MKFFLCKTCLEKYLDCYLFLMENIEPLVHEIEISYLKSERNALYDLVCELEETLSGKIVTNNHLPDHLKRI